MISLTPHDKSILSRIGHGAYGKELIGIIEKARAQVLSLDDLEPGTDHNAAVEGRLLFKEFANEVIRHLKFEERAHRAIDPEASIGDSSYD